MTQDFEEFKKINDMISRAQLANTAADMVKMQADANSIQSELAKFSGNASAFAQISLASDAAIAMEKNQTVTNQLESELAKLTGKSSAIEQYLSEEKMLREHLNQSQSNSHIGMESAKSLLQDYESATKAIDMSAIAAYRDASNRDIYHGPRIETQKFHIPNFHLQKNPILETNKRLERLESIADEKNEKLKQINLAAETLAKNHALDSSENKKSTNLMRVFTIIGLIVGVIGVYLTYVGIQDNREINLKSTKEKAVNELVKK